MGRAAPEGVMKHARGTFDVELVPQPLARESAGATLGRMTIDKRFYGDLEGTSMGEMLSAGTSVPDSAGYVAIELVSGALHGRRGTFILQHSGTMDRGGGELVITVVPDSGTGELVGLRGALTIEVVDGEHRYDFAYTLGDEP